MTKKKDKKDHKNAGRPTVFTDETLHKLSEAFALGCTDLEACLFAGVGKSALYNYQKANPSFVEQKEILKESPVLLARTTVVKAIEKDADLAMKYLERKKKDEFSIRTESTGKNGGPIEVGYSDMTDDQLAAKIKAMQYDG